VRGPHFLRGLGRQQILAAAVNQRQLSRQAGKQKVKPEDVNGERISVEPAQQIAGERHDGDGEQEQEVPPRQAGRGEHQRGQDRQT
jgi:hypothetical protein